MWTIPSLYTVCSLLLTSGESQRQSLCQPQWQNNTTGLFHTHVAAHVQACMESYVNSITKNFNLTHTERGIRHTESWEWVEPHHLKASCSFNGSVSQPFRLPLYPLHTHTFQSPHSVSKISHTGPVDWLALKGSESHYRRLIELLINLLHHVTSDPTVTRLEVTYISALWHSSYEWVSLFVLVFFFNSLFLSLSFSLSCSFFLSLSLSLILSLSISCQYCPLSLHHSIPHLRVSLWSHWIETLCCYYVVAMCGLLSTVVYFIHISLYPPLKMIVHPNYKITHWFPYPISSLWTRYDIDFYLATVSNAIFSAFVTQIRCKPMVCLVRFVTSSIGNFIELHNAFLDTFGWFGPATQTC